jgi:hypothetical protein
VSWKMKKCDRFTPVKSCFSDSKVNMSSLYQVLVSWTFSLPPASRHVDPVRSYSSDMAASSSVYHLLKRLCIYDVDL